MKAVMWMLAVVSVSAGATPRIIGGQTIPWESRPEVAVMKNNSAICSGVLVGHRVMLMAGHCATTGDRVQARFQSETASGTAYRSPLYPQVDHDLAAVILDNAPKVPPVSLAESAEYGDAVMLSGFGCTSPGEKIPESLQQGLAVLVSSQNHDLVTQGAAACFGDSGGPAYVYELGRFSVIGVISKGNIKDTTYVARIDDEEGQKFLTEIAAQFAVQICGFNSTCGIN